MSALKEKVLGRGPLSDMEVNPAAYLEMGTKLLQAERRGQANLVGYDWDKLNVAFGKFMRDNMGKSRRGEKKNTDTLRKLAKDFLREAAKKEAKKNKAGAGKPSSQAQRAADTLEANGWDLGENDVLDSVMDDGDIPSIAPDMFDAMDDFDLAQGLVEVARDLGPTLAVGTLLLANDLADVGVASCELIVEKYDDETGNTQSKETCLLGLQEMMEAQTEHAAVADKLELLAMKEEDPQLQAQLLQLARPDNTGEDAAEIDNVAAVDAFTDNGLSVVHFKGRFEAPPVPAHMTVVQDPKEKYKHNPMFIDPTPKGPSFEKPWDNLN
jgi:hypothetical protein